MDRKRRRDSRSRSPRRFDAAPPKRSRMSPPPPRRFDPPPSRPAPNHADDRAARLAAMTSSASTLTEERKERLTTLLAQEKAELEAEERARAKSGGMGSFLSHEQKKVFGGALAVKKASVPGPSQLVDAVVMSQIKAATGGKLRLALSGGAALSKETQEFLSLALVTVLQGPAHFYFWIVPTLT